MCGETRDRVDFGPLHQGPRNSPPLPPYIQPLGHRLDFGVLFRLKVRHSCNFAYFVCVQRPDKGVTEPHLDQ